MAKSEVRSKRARKPRFRKGQVVATKSGGEYLRILRVLGRGDRYKCFLPSVREFNTARWDESELRPLTKAERGEGVRRGK